MSNLLVLVLLLSSLGIAVFFGSFLLAVIIYVISHLYPWLRKIAVWSAKLENLIPLFLLSVILFILIILGYALLHSILILLLLPLPLLLFFPIDLGILVWLIRLVRWIYFRWRGWLVGIYTAMRLQVIKVKIKVDVQKETDWKVKFAEMKNKLSEEAEQTRRKISGRGK